MKTKNVNIKIGSRWPNHVSSFKEFKGIGGAYFVVDESAHTHVLLFKPTIQEEDKDRYRDPFLNVRIYEYRKFLVNYFEIGEEVFPIYFSPHKYSQNQALMECLNNISKMTVYLIDSIDFTVHSIIDAQISTGIRQCWQESWNYMLKVENCDEVYSNWIRRKGLTATFRMLKDAKDYGNLSCISKDQCDITLLLKASLTK